MAFKEMVKMKLLDVQLQHARTGDSYNLSRTIGVSRSNLFKMFNELKYAGAEISFDSKNITYYYRNDFTIDFRINIQNSKVLEFNDLEKIFI